MTVKIELGTLIHGTLRSEDLLQAFASELYRLAGGTGEVLLLTVQPVDIPK